MKRLFIGLSLLLATSSSLWAFTQETFSIPSDRIPKPMDVTVITPDAAKADASATFPTVYLLNGFSGNNTAWYTSTDTKLGEYADKYGMIFVMPNGMDSWYWDSPKNPKMQMESFIIKELVPTIDKKYPTKQDRSQRAITGLSMGGHGAMWLAIRHDDIFGNVGSMSGGVDIRPFPNNWKMKEWLGERDSNKELWDSMTVINLVPSLKDKQLNITFDCGVDDFFAKVNNNLHEAMVEAKIPHDYTSRPGAHTHEYWRNSLAYHLLFFDRSFRNVK